MYVVDAVVAFDRLLTVGVVTGGSDVIQTTPGVRNLIIADINGLIRDMIGLVDEQVQAIDAVATELRVELISVVTCCIERILFDEGATGTIMLPYVRCIYVCDMNRCVMEVTRVNIQTQGNDTVATMNRSEGIVILSGSVEEARLVRLGQTEAHRVTFADPSTNRIMLNRHHSYETNMCAVCHVVVCT